MKQLRWLGMVMVAMVLIGCANNTGTVVPTGHDMSSMNNDTPYDALFIDSMIVHHQGAITMAQEALEKAQHTELKTFAQNVIIVQNGEITQMQKWLTSNQKMSQRCWLQIFLQKRSMESGSRFLERVY